MFEKMTKYIPDLENEDTAERGISKLEDKVYIFVHNNPDCGLKYYREILKSRGINLDKISLDEVDGEGRSWLAVMALLVAAMNEERRSVGTLKRLNENGKLKSWLERLKEIDEKGIGESADARE